MEYSEKVKTLEILKKKLKEELHKCRDEIKKQKSKEALEHLGIVPYETIVVYEGKEYKIDHFEGYWLYGRQILKNGNLHKTIRTIYDGWKIKE